MLKLELASTLVGIHIGLMSKRCYRGFRSSHGSKKFVEQLEDRYVSLTSLYNQLEELHVTAKKHNNELINKNKMLFL